MVRALFNFITNTKLSSGTIYLIILIAALELRRDFSNLTVIQTTEIAKAFRSPPPGEMNSINNPSTHINLYRSSVGGADDQGFNSSASMATDVWSAWFICEPSAMDSR